MWRKSILGLMVVVGLAAIGSLFAGRASSFRQEIKSCFDDVRGLRPGAQVRLAGVDVGTVRSVHAEPHNKGCPAEVEMYLVTSYALPIPEDSLTDIETAGVLGERYVSIDVSRASGPSIENYGYLKSKPTRPQRSLEDVVRGMAEGLRGSKSADDATANGPVNRAKP